MRAGNPGSDVHGLLFSMEREGCKRFGARFRMPCLTTHAGEAPTATNRSQKCRERLTQPNNRIQATAYSLRSCLASASGSA